MISDQEIRAQAAQAAATVATTVGLGDATGFLKVASMIETYISTGAEAAQKVVDSWSDPASDASSQDTRVVPNDDSPTDSRAQELATEAYRAKTRDQLKVIIDMAKKEELGTAHVVVGKMSGPLGDYLNNRWAAVGTSLPLHQRNKRPPQDAVSSTRADLGL